MAEQHDVHDWWRSKGFEPKVLEAKLVGGSGVPHAAFYRALSYVHGRLMDGKAVADIELYRYLCNVIRERSYEQMPDTHATLLERAMRKVKDLQVERDRLKKLPETYAHQLEQAKSQIAALEDEIRTYQTAPDVDTALVERLHLAKQERDQFKIRAWMATACMWLALFAMLYMARQ